MFISILLQRQRQFKAQKHLLLKNRNELMVGMAKCNALSVQYFNMDILDIIQVYVRVGGCEGVRMGGLGCEGGRVRV